MLNEIRASWALLLGIGFMMLGNGLQGTLLGVRATIEGFETFTTGVVMAFYFMGMLVGGVLTPQLVKRVGHIRVFAALASMASIAILLHSVYVNPWTWSAMVNINPSILRCNDKTYSRSSTTFHICWNGYAPGWSREASGRFCNCACRALAGWPWYCYGHCHGVLCRLVRLNPSCDHGRWHDNDDQNA